MTNEQMNTIMQAIHELSTDVKEIKEDVNLLKQDVSELKEDVVILKQDVSELKGDTKWLKHEQTKTGNRMDRSEKKMDFLMHRAIEHDERLFQLEQ